MKKFVIIISAILFTTTIMSCSSTVDEKIDLATIDGKIKEIKKENPDFDSLKIDILDELLIFSKGRDAFIKNEIAKNKGKENPLMDYVVEKEDFKNAIDNLFNYFKANNITYKTLLMDVDSLKTINEKFDNKLKSTYEEIDKICNERQKQINENEIKALEIKEKLSKLVTLELLSITEIEYNYSAAVEVKIKMTNKTNKPIDAIAFNMEFTDKLGNKIANIICKSNDRFNGSDVGAWIYGIYDRSEIYESLKNTRASHVMSKSEITKINIGGELISAYDMDLENLKNINFEYKTPKNLHGYCLYLEKDSELQKQIDDAENEKQKEIENRLFIYSKYRENLKKTYDFSKMTQEVL